MDGRTNAVFGVRAFDGYTSHSFLYVLGNKGVTLVANVLFNVYLRDLMTCHKAIRTDVFKSLPLRARASRSSRRSPHGCSSTASASSRCRCTTRRAAARRARSSPAPMGLRVVATLSAAASRRR